MDTMSRNTHPEVTPPVLYVPIDERVDGELGFSLAHMVDQTRVLLAYTSLDRLLNGYDNLGESAEEVTPTLPSALMAGSQPTSSRISWGPSTMRDQAMGW